MLWASLTYYGVGYRFVIYWCYYLERCSFCCQGFFLELLLWRHIGFCQKHFLHLLVWSYAKLALGIKQKRNWCEEETWLGLEHEYSISYFVGSNLKSFSIPSQAPRCLIHPWVLLCKVRPQVPVIHLGKLQESNCNAVPFSRQSFLVLDFLV